MEQFSILNEELFQLVGKWETILKSLPLNVITERRNGQNRTIKQIVGHMVDSASNNTHRMIHLQYGVNPLVFPDYAALGNNDRWIVIQNYQNENWHDLVQLWKYSNLHIIHVINQINDDKLENTWISALNEKIPLKKMIEDYLPHFKLHIREIEELATDNAE